MGTAGTLYLYALSIPQTSGLFEDIALTLVPPNHVDPTEGLVLRRTAYELVVQTQESLGQAASDTTLVPDVAGFFETASQRLADMAASPESYTLGPAERLLPWLDPHQEAGYVEAREKASAAVLTTIWDDDPAGRWAKLAKLVVDLVRQNKRILLLAPDPQMVDELMGFVANALRIGALPYKSLLSRYEVPVLSDASGIPLSALGFEAQMYGFFAKSRAHKDVLRTQYNRFRELTPILAYKSQKQHDLNEVKLLEWRLLAQLSEYQGKIKDIDKTVAEYEAIPIWKRLAMQAVGKNSETLGEYRDLYEGKIPPLMQEIEIAQARIRDLASEAAVPKEMRPEYDTLKEEIVRLGGTPKIRELLAAGEKANRQAFLQNKRVVVTTPGRVVTDPLFRRMRFDTLIVDDAPRIPAPFLLGAAGLIRERIVMSGKTQDLFPARRRRRCLGDVLAAAMFSTAIAHIRDCLMLSFCSLDGL